MQRHKQIFFRTTQLHLLGIPLFAGLILLSPTTIQAEPATVTKAAIESTSLGSHRSEKHISRNSYRNPVRTLDFLGIRPDMTVVEIWPGPNGWYTEILAPLVKERGAFYAAHFPKKSKIKFFSRSHRKFVEKMEASPEQYSHVIVTDFFPNKYPTAAPPESADMVLTFRNVHNWVKADREKAFFKAFYDTLKPGGILGVIEHRGDASMKREEMASSGYVPESYVIELAKEVGFKLVAKAEFNNNVKDSKNHPKGVWTLPPSLRLKDQNREKYLDIGESDRMTLKFIKRR